MQNRNPAPQSSNSIVDVLSMLELEEENTSSDDDELPDRCCASSMSSAGWTQHVEEDSTSKHHVSFSTVDVREYAVTIGDHPYCSSGVPLALDWSVTTFHSVDLAAFEDNHPPRRTRAELVRPWEERRELYLDDTPELRRAQRIRQRRRCREQNYGQAFFATISTTTPAAAAMKL